MLKGAGFVKWASIIGGWTILSFLYTGQLHLYNNFCGVNSLWSESFKEALAYFYSWAILTPLILICILKIRFSRRAYYRPLLFHLCLSLIFSLAHTVLNSIVDVTLVHWGASSYSLKETIEYFFSKSFFVGLVVYWAVVALYHALLYYRRQEVIGVEMEASLVQAELHAIKMQLPPHFLFNSLNSISALMHEDVKAANNMLSQMSELLRRTLRSLDVEEVTLREELEVLGLYLNVEKTRFQDQLTIDIDIEPVAYKAYVPHMILQPLVENSILHGINKRKGGGRIKISARKRGANLEITIRDNGAGIEKKRAQRDKSSVGLLNTQTRLAKLYRQAHYFRIHSMRGEGTEVTIIIPFHTEPLLSMKGSKEAALVFGR